MIRRLALAAALLASAASAQVRTSTLPNASSLSLSDRLTITQGMTSPRTVNGTAAQLFGLMTPAQINAALGYTPANAATLGALATQNAVTASQLPTVSGFAGGTFGDSTHTITSSLDQYGRTVNVQSNLITPAGIGADPAGAASGLVFSGDVTKPASSSVLTLKTVQSSPGTYGSGTAAPIITVDAQGRVTSISTAAITGAGGGGATTTDASQLTAGTLSAERLPGSSGDVTAPSGSNVLTLANVNSLPGTAGDSSHVAVPTVNSKGLVTGVASALITPAAISAMSVAPLVPGHTSSTRALTPLLGAMAVSPEEFGAVGDGSTNDTTAFQSAINFASANGLTLTCANRTYKAGGLTVTPSLRMMLCAGAGIDGPGLGVSGITLTNGNYSNSYYLLPSVFDQGGSGVLLYGASFANIVIPNSQNNSNGITVQCDNTYLGCIDNTITFGTLAGNTNAAFYWNLSGTAAGRNMQGLKISGNFMNGNKAGIKIVSGQDSDAQLFNDSEFHITAIDGDCGTRSSCGAPYSSDQGIITSHAIIGPLVFDIPGFFGQFGAQSFSGINIAAGSSGLSFNLGVADLPAYDYYNVAGAGNRLVSTNRAENVPSTAIQCALTPTARSTFNGGAPLFANRTWLYYPSGSLSYSAGQIFYAYAFSPYLTGYESPRVTPAFSADISVLSVQDASIVAGVDGSATANLIVIKLRANSAVSSSNGNQLFQLIVGE